MKCDLIKCSFIIARDSNGTEYMIKDSERTEELIQKDVEGEVDVVFEQLLLDNGHYTSSYTSLNFFKITE